MVKAMIGAVVVGCSGGGETRTAPPPVEASVPRPAVPPPEPWNVASTPPTTKRIAEVPATEPTHFDFEAGGKTVRVHVAAGNWRAREQRRENTLEDVELVPASYANVEVTLDLTCHGACGESKLPDNIRGRATRAFAAMPSARWIIAPRRDPAGYWIWHLAARVPETPTDAHLLTVDRIVPQTSQLLSCKARVARLIDDDDRWVNAVEALCRGIEIEVLSPP